jgi:hypothetical protein
MRSRDFAAHLLFNDHCNSAKDLFRQQLAAPIKAASSPNNAVLISISGNFIACMLFNNASLKYA